ncbi:unnamed protein product [Clonostachys rhizophaga]|uniref:Zn(2)-C6 fungal-type domain-containing protein n=1 Tax=Clonostachys rhizophaga TaxID=160324 RepID=A0A9N9VYQ9_9HYPO|nr:unnamed protein product [Clonostachys rhizophaga]
MPISRKKACTNCRSSKAGCDRALPACHRCVEKQLRCMYDGRKRDRFSPLARPLLPRVAKSHIQGSAANSSDTSENPAIGGPRPPAQSTAAFPIEWWGSDEFGNSIDSTAEKGASNSLIRLEPPIGASACSITGTPSRFSLDETLTAPALGIPGLSYSTPDSQLSSVTQRSDSRKLRQRYPLRDCLLGVAVLGQLCSYPKMMIEGLQLPPFIKAPCHQNEELAPGCVTAGRHQCFPKRLDACAGLVQMYYSRTDENVDAIWSMIYAEVAKLASEVRMDPELEQLTTLQCPVPNAEEKLEIMQCLTIFLLLQADDPQSYEANDIDFLLTVAIDTYYDLALTQEWRFELPNVRPLYREWIFRETMRRLMIIYGIFDLLLEGIVGTDKTGCKGGSGLSNASLPCTRDMWEASTVRTWVACYQRYISSRQSGVMLLTRHIMELRLTDPFAIPLGDSPISEMVHWCKGMDTLGNLIWMVLPLQQYRIRDDTRAIW